MKAKTIDEHCGRPPGSFKRFCKVQQRFHELAMKEAIGIITPEELSKLERYDRLRGPERTQQEILAEAKKDYELRKAKKKLYEIMHGINRTTAPTNTHE